jgi:citrate lyase subunit beta/citryl-CoA lyase
VLPKVETAADLQTGEWLLQTLENERGLPSGGIDLIPIIETGLGFSNIKAIARAARRTRRLSFGAGDFTLDVGITWSAAETELLPYRCSFVVESRAAGLEPPLDTVWVALKDDEGFRRSVQHVKDIGFQGKLCIHPDQVPVVNERFRPSGKELARARRIVEAFAQAEREGLAAIQVDGQFVDYPIVYLAQRVIARADAIAAAERAA